MTTIDKRLVRVVFRKQVSDDHYGSETAEVSLDWTVKDDDDNNGRMDEEAAEEMLGAARKLVHEQLATSPSATVRRAVQVQLPQGAPLLTQPGWERELDDAELAEEPR